MSLITYELSQLHKGWRETSSDQEDAAIEAIQEITGWNSRQAEEAFMEAEKQLYLAEKRTTEDSAQAYYDKHGSYPTKPFHPHCKVEIDGYIVSRRRVKTIHSSERRRMKYTWKPL